MFIVPYWGYREHLFDRWDLLPTPQADHRDLTGKWGVGYMYKGTLYPACLILLFTLGFPFPHLWPLGFLPYPPSPSRHIVIIYWLIRGGRVGSGVVNELWNLALLHFPMDGFRKCKSTGVS